MLNSGIDTKNMIRNELAIIESETKYLRIILSCFEFMISSFLVIIGGAKGIWTPDPLHAIQVRYQLRHSPDLFVTEIELYRNLCE